MKVKYKEVKDSFCGEVYSYYIRLYKYWWSLWWHIEKDGYTPVQYDLIEGEFIRRRIWSHLAKH